MPSGLRLKLGMGGQRQWTPVDRALAVAVEAMAPIIAIAGIAETAGVGEGVGDLLRRARRHRRRG